MFNVFLSCSNNGKDTKLLAKFRTHLAVLEQGDYPLIKCVDSFVTPGANRRKQIQNYIQKADIVILFISADFISDTFISSEIIPLAITLHNEASCHLVPVLLDDCYYEPTLFSELEMLPKPIDKGELVAVTNWSNTDTAFTTIIKSLVDLIRNLDSQKPVSPLYQLDTVSSKSSNISNWYEFFHSSKLKTSTLSLLDTVNCDRTLHYKQKLWSHFKAYSLSAQNLAYVISACSTQNPKSLVRRLFYYFSAFEEDSPISYFPQANTEEVYFAEIHFSGSRTQVVNRFMMELDQHFLQPHGLTFSELEKSSPNIWSQHTRIAFPFVIHRNAWNDYEVDECIAAFLSKIQTLIPSCKKFAFFFICYFPDLHLSQSEECEILTKRLTALGGQTSTHFLHINGLPPIGVTDVRNWADQLLPRPTVEQLLKILRRKLLLARSKAYEIEDLIDMDIVEEMQYEAYRYLLNNYD